MSDKEAGQGAVGKSAGTLQQLITELDPRALQALKEDPVFTRQVVEALPDLLMAKRRMVGVLADYLSGLSPGERKSLLESAISKVDGAAIAESINISSVLAMNIHKENPDLMEGAFPEIEKLMSDTDFGKVRESVTARLEYVTAVMSKVIEEALANPVIIANLLGIIPPVANSAIRLLSALVEELDMPPEILASAVFNTLSALDAEELGRVFTNISKQINLLHAGNIVLGGDEPRFRAVFTDFSKRMLDNLDMKAATGAVVALTEDLEVALGTMTELTSRDPEMLLPIARMVASVGNSIVRICSSSLSEWTTLPEETMEKVGMVVHEISDAVEIGRMVDSFITLALRLREANPDIQGERLADALQAINTERLELLLRGMAGDFKRAALTNPGIKMTLQPEEIGRRANEFIVGFNRSASPAAVKDYLVEMFSVIDARELGRLLVSVMGGFTEAIFSRRETALTVVKTVVSSVVGITKNLIKLVFKRG